MFCTCTGKVQSPNRIGQSFQSYAFSEAITKFRQQWLVNDPIFLGSVVSRDLLGDALRLRIPIEINRVDSLFEKKLPPKGFVGVHARMLKRVSDHLVSFSKLCSEPLLFFALTLGLLA